MARFNHLPSPFITLKKFPHFYVSVLCLFLFFTMAMALKHLPSNTNNNLSTFAYETYSQEIAIKKEVAALNMIINCITSHGLESQYSPVQLKERVGQLLRQKTGQRSAALLRATNTQLPDVVDKRIVVKSKAQPQEEAHWRASVTSSPSSQSQTQEPQCGKKRFAQIPDHDVSSSTQQLNPAKKLACKKLEKKVTLV